MCGQFVLSNINSGYVSDMYDYDCSIPEAAKIERIYENIPKQLAKENKKYQISKIATNARSRDYSSAID